MSNYRQRRGLTYFLFFGGRVAALRHFAEDTAGFPSGHVRRPRRSMPTDRMPTLATIADSVFEKIRDGHAPLPTSAKARDCAFPFVPDGRLRRECGDILESDHVGAVLGSYLGLATK
jgi:hypothetical protein